jgi:hypothetical protein
VPPLVIRKRRAQRPGARESGARIRRLVQLDVHVAQTDLRQRELRIEPQRLVERAPRLDPAVGMQIREPLIVERLGVGGCCGDPVVRAADAGPQRDRPFEQILGNDRDDMRRVLRDGVRVKQKAGKKRQKANETFHVAFCLYRSGRG